MSFLEEFYPETRFGGFSDIDGTVTFYSRINSLLNPSFVVLDIGCGRGLYTDDAVPFRKALRILQNKVEKVIGIDVDKSAQSNPCLDEFYLIEDDSWPIESESIDLIVCDNVLEHIENYDQFFSEIRHVLKNGGYLCLRTSNRWSYFAIAARLIPNRYHTAVTSFVQDRRKYEDVFPTLYKCNSVGMIKRIMTSKGFQSVVYSYEAEPAYLSFSKLAYYFGVLHQKFAPSLIKPTIFAFGKIQK